MFKDFRLYPITGDYGFVGGDLETGDDLGNNLYLSLITEKGSWFAKPKFGSRLHLLNREKAVDELPARAHEYCLEALQWTIDEGRAEKIEVETALDRSLTSRLNIHVRAWQGGMPQDYSYFVEVI